jgi:hypothetical protein
MHTPQMPAAGVMTDTLDFLKNFWSGVPGASAMSGMVLPSMSVEELDKKISDLKAVEAWLNLNMTMLRGSIQALEVQRATVATLQSMGTALAGSVKVPEGDEHNSLLASVPYASAFFAGTRAAAEKKSARGGNGKQAPAESASNPAANGAAREDGAAAPAKAADAAPAMPGLPNPAVWWNMLQEQFKQAVSSAVGPETAARMDEAGKAATAEAQAMFTPGAKADKAAAKPAAKSKPAAKTARSKSAPTT